MLAICSYNPTNKCDNYLWYSNHQCYYYGIYEPSQLLYDVLCISRWWQDPVSALDLQPTKTLLPTSTCAEAINIMKESNLSEIPIVEEK